MTLADQIIDEAELLATNQILPVDCSDHAIIDAVSDIVNVRLGYKSTGARLALAAYNRYDLETQISAINTAA